MHKLLIVESPAKAKTISKYLNDEYTVKASVGHIRDLPKSNKKAVDIEAAFKPHYEIVKGKEKVVSELRSLAAEADEIVLATDPDREGEAIAWHIAEALDLSDDPNTKRIVFHEITEDAVKEAMQHPRGIDHNLRRAQEARRVLDRLVGYDLSGLIWKKVRYGLSAGRVQSPALRILVEREREIRAFKAETYWVIAALTKTQKGEPLLVTCTVEPRDKSEMEKIVAAAERGSFKVTDVTESAAKRSPRPPFITSTLQQAASTRLGFAPSRTMAIAQRLYEAGLITYMRTDSTNLSEVARKQAFAVIEKEYGKEMVSPRTFAKKSKNAQEAHEAIRPSNLGKQHAGNTPEQRKLYRLIWQRTIASQMKEAEILRTKITANVAEEGIPDFAATGSRIVSPGWLLADPEARGEDNILPKVEKGENLTLEKVTTEEKQTEPPPRYSEAGLVKELEKRGIGRPSTYASIIKTLEDRGYVEKLNRSLKPTDTGEVVSGFLEEHFGKYISDTFTAHMEDDLDEIANGNKEYGKILAEFYKPFHEDVLSKENTEKVTNLGEADPKFKCPVCGSSMTIKLGKNGRFLSCSRFPDCTGALTIDGVEIKPDEPIGIYPETGQEIYVLSGKFGPYIQLGKPEKGKKKGDKPKRASIPKGKDLSTITLLDAIKYLSVPRLLGTHPDTGKTITASIGRFGPYIVHDGDFRSIKAPDDVYEITLERALEMLAQPKVKGRRGRKKKEE